MVYIYIKKIGYGFSKSCHTLLPYFFPPHTSVNRLRLCTGISANITRQLSVPSHSRFLQMFQTQHGHFHLPNRNSNKSLIIYYYYYYLKLLGKVISDSAKENFQMLKFLKDFSQNC